MRFPYNIIYFFRYEIKYFFQRLFRGYDNTDVWGLDYYMCKKIEKPLKRLRDHHCGYPPSISNEEWDIILDKIIFSVDSVLSDDFFERLSNDKEASIKHGEKVQEGFELLGKYFQNLWD